MKKILFAATAFLLFVSGVFATEKSAFESALTKTKFNIENYHNEDYQENLFKKDEDKKKFKDLPALEKRVYIVMFGNEVNGKLAELNGFWEEELKKAGDGSDIEASKADVQKYIDALLELRIQNAEKVENLATKLFIDYPDKFTKEEKEFTLKILKTFTAKLKEK